MCNVAKILGIAFVVLFFAGCSEREHVSVVSTSVRLGPLTTEKTTNPEIRFTAFDAPSPGTIESVSGEVDRFTPQGWIPLRPGDILESGARFQLGSGASAKVRFAAQHAFTFAPQRDVRGFILQVPTK